MKRPKTLAEVKDEEVLAYVDYLEEIVMKADPDDVSIIKVLNKKQEVLEKEVDECETDDLKKKCQQLKELTKTIDFYKDRLKPKEEKKKEKAKSDVDLGEMSVEKYAD